MKTVIVVALAAVLGAAVLGVGGHAAKDKTWVTKVWKSAADKGE